MLKKILATSAVLAVSSSVAMADGAYLGANLGYESGTWNLKNSAGSSTPFNASGVNTGLFGGYGKAVNQIYYLGGEAFLDWSTTQSATKNIANGVTGKLRTTYGYGLSFIPGIKVATDTLAYARVGIVRTRFELTQDPAPTTNSKFTTGNTVTGGQLGLGVLTHLTTNVDLRGEYVYTSYRSFDAYGSKISPNNSMLNVGMVYNFV
jgi:opacity protein-like surface antigen